MFSGRRMEAEAGVVAAGRDHAKGGAQTSYRAARRQPRDRKASQRSADFKVLHQTFEAQVDARSGAVAVVFEARREPTLSWNGRPIVSRVIWASGEWVAG